MGRILVVDDDTDILRLCEAVLTHAGHSICTAEDAMAAIDLLNRIEFDMLITDAHMPHFTGFELVSTVRRNSNLSHMSVAMLTGLKERKDVERAIKAGVDEYILKPLDPVLLVQKVLAMFEKRPPTDYPEIHFSALPKSSSSATTQVAFELVTLSELGLVAHTTFEIPLGYVLDVKSPFFEELGAEPPQMRVTLCEFLPSIGKWRVSLSYLGARESYLKRVRRWISNHGGTNRTAA